MTTIRVNPRIWPRDARDLLVSLIIGLGLPTLVVLPVYLVAQSVIAAGVAILVLVVGYVSITVRFLEVSSEGIRFVRFFGRPGFLPWHEVISIDAVGRRELVVRGWLWPPYPPREASTSMTSQGHYRIRTQHRDIYFPLAHPEEFINAVRAHGQYAT